MLPIGFTSLYQRPEVLDWWAPRPRHGARARRLGERDAVLEWLNRAYDAHDVHPIYLPVDPKWDPYRTIPVF